MTRAATFIGVIVNAFNLWMSPSESSRGASLAVLVTMALVGVWRLTDD